MTELTIEQAFNQAVQQHQAGRLAQAEELYNQVLGQQPSHAGALHLLGVIAFQRGRSDSAVDLIRQAIAINPRLPGACYNLGNVLQSQGKLDEAIAAFQQAIAARGNHAEAYNSLGHALQDKGRLDEALAAYSRAISLKPGYAEAHGNLGAALSINAQVDEAIAAYQRAIALKPEYAEAYNNLGICLWKKGQEEEAIAAYRKAIALKTNYAEAHNNLGNALWDSGKRTEAMAAYQKAVAINPNYAEAHYNFAKGMQETGRFDEAIAAYQRAIALKPNYAKAYSNLGSALKETGQTEAAIASYQRAIELNPDLAEAHSSLGNALSGLGRLDEAIAAYRRAVAITSSGSDQRQGPMPAAHRMRAAATFHSNLVFVLHFHADYDAARLLDENRQWAARFEAPLAGEIRTHENNRDPQRRLKVGYVSPDFRTHPTACFSLPLLSNHDARNVEVYCYASVKREDAITARFKQLNVVWRDCLGLSSADVAEIVRRDGIDILVDLALHLADNRLLVFARKPAPVQVTWCGYPGTTGLSSIDYRLTDRFLDPPGETDQYYTERSVRLPNSFWCYQPLIVDTPQVNDPPALSNGYVTLGCFNNFAKVTPQTLRLWMRVLNAVADSRLLLQSHPGSHRDAVIAQFQDNGIASDRLEFVLRAPPTDYFQYYHRVDLCLDPVPYPGHTSSLDALWMGVPTVTLSGNTAASRGGVSILSNVGLPEFIAYSPDEYVSIAAGISGQPERLRELRRSLRSRLQASPLMDGRRFAADIESAYRQMWRNWCA